MRNFVQIGNYYFELLRNDKDECKIMVYKECPFVGGEPHSIGESRTFDSANELGKILAEFLSEFPHSDPYNLNIEPKSIPYPSTKEEKEELKQEYPI